MRKKDKEIVEKFEEEENKKKIIPKRVQERINKELSENIIIAIAIMVFNILLMFGFKNIETPIYIKDIRVFSVTLCVIAIVIWEYSYKKESGKFCLYGIETAVTAIVVMLCTYICILHEDKYYYYLALWSYVESSYYGIKCVKIYKKRKNEYIKTLSDIDEIVKEEKAEKKEETSRKRK